MTKSGGNGKLLTANSQLSTAKQSRELAFAVGEAGANFASKFESEAAISPSAKENAPEKVRFSIRKVRDRERHPSDLFDLCLLTTDYSD